MIYKLKSNQITNIIKEIKDKEKLTIRGLQDAERAFLLSNFDYKILYVSTSVTKARMAQKQFESLGKKCVIISELLDAISYKASANEVLENYLFAMSQVSLNMVDVLIITSEILLAKIPEKSVYLENIIELKKGNDYKIDSLKEGLLNLGYKRVDKVEQCGQFALRGDILDVFPIGLDNAVRLDFWGNSLEDISTIDLVSYSSLNKLQEVSICPCTLNLGIANLSLSFLEKEPNILDKINDGVVDNSLIFALPAYQSYTSNFLKWFIDDLVAIEEPKRVYDLANEMSVQVGNDIVRQVEENLLTKEHLTFYNSMKDLQIKSKQAVIGFSNLDVKNPMFLSDNAYNLQIIHIGNYVKNDELLRSDLKYFQSQKFTVALSYEKDEQKAILERILKDMLLPYNTDGELIENTINLTKQNIAYSVGFLNEKFVFISQDVLFKKSSEVKATTNKSRVFYLPKVGEYVVHEVQGIGKCVDIKRMNLGFSEKDYIVIEYAKGDTLYLPTEHTDEISQYLGGDEPKLSVLGGEQFLKAKQKAKASIKQLAFDLKALYAKRQAAKGFKYSTDNYLVDEFQKNCGFELTVDQEDAIAEIKKDMESGKVMDRLICGDVGFGKTEVAMVAAFKTVLDNKQVAFLAPTTILCHQHYNNLLNRMKDFMINVGMLSRFNTNKENNDVIKRISNGEINIVCGTHRMLSDDVKFKDLGLLILDEEQRFGVADKEKIKRLKENVNVLTLTATPIPRTLHMSLVGIRDTSLITTPPKSRVPITSIVCEYSPDIIKEACKRELSRDGQVLIVYNRVDGIYNFASKIKNLVPEAVIDVAHGQMDKNVLENVILKLYSKQTQILIATTLIENGIDLPMANTLIVINADKLGLGQLYQLRGRVGRSNRSSYAYFTFEKDRIISEVALQRLEALKEFSELGSGFKIAMRDLEIRGAGSMLGAEQSGHIEKIGYDLYCKLLEEAMMELEGHKDMIKREVKIEIALPAYAPDEYITSSNERMKLYNDISMMSNLESMQNLSKRITDTYGKIPEPLEQLIKVGYIKNLAQNCMVKRIVINDYASYIEFYDDETERIEDAQKVASEEFKLNLKVDAEKSYKLNINKALSIKDRQSLIIKFLLKLQKVVA